MLSWKARFMSHTYNRQAAVYHTRTMTLRTNTTTKTNKFTDTHLQCKATIMLRDSIIPMSSMLINSLIQQHIKQALLLLAQFHRRLSLDQGLPNVLVKNIRTMIASTMIFAAFPRFSAASLFTEPISDGANTRWKGVSMHGYVRRVLWTGGMVRDGCG